MWLFLTMATAKAPVSCGHGECHVHLQRVSGHVLDEILVRWRNDNGVSAACPRETLLECERWSLHAPLPSSGGPCRTLEARQACAGTQSPASTAHSTRCSFSAESLWWCFRRSDALTRPARCRSDLQADELLEENAMQLAVARETHCRSQILIALRTGRVTVHELLFAQMLTIARGHVPGTPSMSHTVPAASLESSSTCEPCWCTSSKKRMLHNGPSAISSRDPSPHPPV